MLLFGEIKLHVWNPLEKKWRGLRSVITGVVVN